MSEKRKDSKGRALWNNEYQRADGKYEFRYFDQKGVRRSVYSWTLNQTDRVPRGKRGGLCLRELERQIEQDMQDGIKRHAAQRMTLNDMFKLHMEYRTLKDSTRVNYNYMYGKYIREGLGRRRLADIRYSDIVGLYTHLIEVLNFKPRSMEVMHTILHPIFTTAVRDGYIRLNPTDGAMTEIKKRRDWEKPKRHALTEDQQAAFVDYLKNSASYNHWLPLFTVLLGTGCRIGEAMGLRWDDCNFEQRVIRISQNLIYRPQENGKCEFHITTPKTKGSIREIPMFPEVHAALMKEREAQAATGFNKTVIDGISGFIFQTRFGTACSPHNVNRAIERICRDYNAEESERAQREERPPLLLPHFSAHNLRHTFCTRLCENTSDQLTLKTIQEIMGHSSIATTLDIYTEIGLDKKQKAFESLHGKISLG